MSRDLVIDVNLYQTRVALVADGVIDELLIEKRGQGRLVGNIYKGKVQNVLPGMQAAFVDIGLERNAFLYAGDIQIDGSDFIFNGKPTDVKMPVPNIKDMVKVGQEIIVQLVKEGVGTKGARITTNITLPLRTLVLMPTVNYVGVSRRIEDDEERTRLRDILESIKIDNMGAIVRTAGEGKSREEFEKDLECLTKMWSKIQEEAKLRSAPCLLHEEESLVMRTVRDMFTSKIDHLYINDREYYEKVRTAVSISSPTLSDKVVLYDRLPDMFDKFKLETSIDDALSRKVWFKNGGYIIIDRTEALTIIDVNTGKYVGTDNLQETITETNCEAAVEIARQLRIRDISGIIIIDFIDMDEVEDKERVVNALKEELKKDRTKSTVLGITSLGLVEMTRKKTRYCVDDTLRVPCPYCGGEGRVLSPETVLMKARKKLRRCFESENMKEYELTLHPDVAKYMEGDEDIVIPRAEGKTVTVKTDPHMHVCDFRVEAVINKN